MRLQKIHIINLICFLVILNCVNKIAVCENIQQNDIKNGAVVLFSEYQFIIKVSNLIYEKDGKMLKIPIFEGDMGDVNYKEFRNYCEGKGYLQPKVAETNFVIITEKNKLTKTFREFLMFYKGNILSNTDIAKPGKIVYDGGALELYYDFQIDSIHFVLQVNISTDRDEIVPGSIKSILDVNLDEKMKTPMFTYRFWKNKTSKKF